MKRYFSTLHLFAISFWLLAPCSMLHAAPPNIIVFFTDDHGYADPIKEFTA